MSLTIDLFNQLIKIVPFQYAITNNEKHLVIALAKSIQNNIITKIIAKRLINDSLCGTLTYKELSYYNTQDLSNEINKEAKALFLNNISEIIKNLNAIKSNNQLNDVNTYSDKINTIINMLTEKLYRDIIITSIELDYDIAIALPYDIHTTDLDLYFTI